MKRGAGHDVGPAPGGRLLDTFGRIARWRSGWFRAQIGRWNRQELAFLPCDSMCGREMLHSLSNRRAAAMLVTSARSALPGHRGSGKYTPPPQSKTTGLRELLRTAERGPMWSTRQLDIFKPDASEPDEQTLFYAGDLALVSRPCVSIVGKREATPAGRKRASRVARELVKRGVVIVSGLARGIDTAAHLSALENGGQTIAVIGTPLSNWPPRRRTSPSKWQRKH